MENRNPSSQNQKLLVVIFIKDLLNSLKNNIRSLMSDTFTACTFIFVMSSIFWPFAFLVIDGSNKKLDYLNVLGTWFGSVATFSAVCVSLYLSLHHGYSKLKITLQKDGVFTITIENFNEFSVAFRLDPSARVNKFSKFDNWKIEKLFSECFRVDGAIKESSCFVVDPLSVVVIGFSTSNFSENILSTKVPDFSADEIIYSLEIETLVHHQRFVTSGTLNDMI